MAASNSDFTVRVHASVENIITQANEELRSVANANADAALSNQNMVVEGLSVPGSVAGIMIPEPTDSPNPQNMLSSNIILNNINLIPANLAISNQIKAESQPQTAMQTNHDMIAVEEAKRKASNTILVRDPVQALDSGNDLGEIDHEVEEEFKRLTQTTPILKKVSVQPKGTTDQRLEEANANMRHHS